MCNAQILVIKIIDGIYSIWFTLLFYSYTSNLENNIFIKLSRELYFAWTHWTVYFCGTSVHHTFKEFRHLIEILKVEAEAEVVEVEVQIEVEVPEHSEHFRANQKLEHLNQMPLKHWQAWDINHIGSLFQFFTSHPVKKYLLIFSLNLPSKHMNILHTA